MPAQTVYEFRATAARSAAVSTHSSFAVENVISICDSPAFTRDAEADLPEINRDGLGCARGVRAAFVLEGGLGLLIYGIWHLCHLAH